MHADLKYIDDLFNYTRGRFVCDEEHEMAQRQVRFNVNELARHAAAAVDANTCVNVTKYPDGMYNKSMLLTMDNGTRVVAKVPNPNAGQPHFTTASEVATMDFVSSKLELALLCLLNNVQARDILQIPVPKVVAWCSQTRENPVGSEYIIMEEVPGVQLEYVWPSMSIQDRLGVVKSIASYQKAWTSTSFTSYGSLYFAKDLNGSPNKQPLYLDANGDHIINEAFAIGPSTAREMFDNGKGAIEFNRGPCEYAFQSHIFLANTNKGIPWRSTTFPSDIVR